MHGPAQQMAFDARLVSPEVAEVEGDQAGSPANEGPFVGSGGRGLPMSVPFLQ
jgi:hypothetical protein